MLFYVNISFCCFCSFIHLKLQKGCTLLLFHCFDLYFCIYIYTYIHICFSSFTPCILGLSCLAFFPPDTATRSFQNMDDGTVPAHNFNLCCDCSICLFIFVGRLLLSPCCVYCDMWHCTCVFV